MRRKMRDFLVLCIITTTLVCSVSILTQTKSAQIYKTMDRVYFYIYKIEITDDLDGKGSGTITLSIDFKYKRLFGTYGEPMLSDGEYDDTGDDYRFVVTFDYETEGDVTVNDPFPQSYCMRITDVSNAYKLTLKVSKGIWNEYETIYLGTGKYYNTDYSTSEIGFMEKFDGMLKLYYKVVY